MKNFIPSGIFLLAAVIGCGKALAQDEEEEAFMSADRVSTDEVMVDQHGLKNEAFIQQVNASAASARADQSGVANYIDLVQKGSIAITVSQDGSGNSYMADIEGYDAKIDITQRGSENILFESLLLENSGFTIIQEGTRNEIIHTGASSNMAPIEIRQQGSDMKLIIQTSH